MRDADGLPYPVLVFGQGPHRPDARRDADTNSMFEPDRRAMSAVARDVASHGPGDVQLSAAGAGAELFAGSLDNTQVFERLQAALR